MITINEIKYEHKHVMEIIDTLTSRLSIKDLSTVERDAIIIDLNKWNIIQKYILDKYKQYENA